MSEELSVACSLSDEDLRQREATLVAQFKTGLTATEESGTGYVFRVPGDGKWLTIVANLILAERECCPFLKFELIAEPNMGPLTLRVSGPDGAKEFLKSIFG